MASELMVKRGDTIKRGQIIASRVSPASWGSPHLHFEIAKDLRRFDPLILNGA